MKALIVAIALAGTVWACDAKAEPTVAAPPQPVVQQKTESSSYTVTVKIDDV